MGDVSYPGFQIFRVSEHVTEAQILEAILDIFGDGHALYIDGLPKIEILRTDAPTTNVIISGIRLSFNEIRRRMARRYLHYQNGRSIIQIRDVNLQHANTQMLDTCGQFLYYWSYSKRLFENKYKLCVRSGSPSGHS
ncbi:unnamed protein product [Orchesella dallaii]|uniref:Uncharacterized protein n=1 Tax=Orchesella dallaii TaxID=48710 RepID=A0ABP1PXN0_9HEXA